MMAICSVDRSRGTEYGFPVDYDWAVKCAKELADEEGVEVRVFKLVETHYFKGKPNADAVKPG